MAVNEEKRQVQVAGELVEQAKTLAHSTRAIPHPFDSYRLLGSLVEVQATLAQIYGQLADWHGLVLDGTHYEGEDHRGIPGIPAATQAKALLTQAAKRAAESADMLGKAHSANSVIRWFDEARATDQV